MAAAAARAERARAHIPFVSLAAGRDLACYYYCCRCYCPRRAARRPPATEPSTAACCLLPPPAGQSLVVRRSGGGGLQGSLAWLVLSCWRAGSSALHPPHDQKRSQLWPTGALTLGLDGAIYGRVAGSMLGGCCPDGRQPGPHHRVCLFCTLHHLTRPCVLRFSTPAGLTHPCEQPRCFQSAVAHPLSTRLRRRRGALHVEGAPRADDYRRCGLGSRACFSPTTANPPSVLMTTSR